MSKPSLESLLGHPDVERVTSRVNPELLERRAYVPPRCAVFAHAHTALEADPGFVFSIDREAERQLPGIIHNPVQRVVGVADPDEAQRAAYTRARTIGIVFSGGPAPGGHNVIAGLYDAAMAANPENRVLGFLMGPDGIIEGDVTSRTLTVGEEANVEGSINADSVRICGRVSGEVKSASVVLAKTAKVEGDIVHQSLAIEAGAFIDGHCRRTSSEEIKGETGIQRGSGSPSNLSGPTPVNLGESKSQQAPRTTTAAE